MKILFMCVANSARSQLAEGLAKNIFGTSVEIQSAGSVPTKVNPLAIEALKEIQIDISNHYSKTTDELSPDFLASLDYVITLCAEEVCPILISKAKKLHWPLPDPAGHQELSREEKLELFRKTRDTIREQLVRFKESHKLS
ncbi:MAG: arsenate reductase ArsC [Pseudobdellovibrio sp.]